MNPPGKITKPVKLKKIKRKFLALALAGLTALWPAAALSKSPVSADGTFTYNQEFAYTLRASAAATAAGPTAETAVAGFGGVCELAVLVDITAVSFTGGTAPTAQVRAWVQRSPDGGTTWDDVLALQSAALAAAATEKDAGYYSCRLGTPAAPAAVQDAGGAPPFAQRVGTISDSLRVKWQIVTTGAPTAFSVTFAVTVRGRP